MPPSFWLCQLSNPLTSLVATFLSRTPRLDDPKDPTLPRGSSPHPPPFLLALFLRVLEEQEAVQKAIMGKQRQSP